MRWWVVWVGCVAALAVGVSSPGDAWALECAGDPGSKRIVGEKLPVSALGIPWWYQLDNWYGPLESNVVLERHDGTTYAQVELAVHEPDDGDGASFVSPVDGWRVGERYRLTVSIGGGAPEQREVTIVEDPVDAAIDVNIGEGVIGEIEVGDGDGYSTYIGGVSREIDVVGYVGLDGLVDSLFYEILVDGERYGFLHTGCDERKLGGLSDRREGVMLATFCEENSSRFFKGVSEGEHDVVVRAYFPGTELSWESRHEDVVMVCPGDDGGVGCAARGADGASLAEEACHLPDEGRGCAVGGANKIPPGGELLLLGLGGVIAWRRRSVRGRGGFFQPR